MTEQNTAGNGMTNEDWRRSGVTGSAARFYRVIAFDRPGLGYSKLIPQSKLLALARRGTHGVLGPGRIRRPLAGY